MIRKIIPIITILALSGCYYGKSTAIPRTFSDIPKIFLDSTRKHVTIAELTEKPSHFDDKLVSITGSLQKIDRKGAR